MLFQREKLCKRLNSIPLIGNDDEFVKIRNDNALTQYTNIELSALFQDLGKNNFKGDGVSRVCHWFYASVRIPFRNSSNTISLFSPIL